MNPLFWLLLQPSLALAEETPSFAAFEVHPGERPPARGGRRPPPNPTWEREFYFQPNFGLTGWSNGQGLTTATLVGGEAGLRYWQQARGKKRGKDPLWAGRTRASASFVMASTGSDGMDVRLGSFIGPQWQRLSLQFGPDLFWNQYHYTPTTGLDESVGLDLPVVATLPIDPLTLVAGITPAWLANEDRRVDWSKTDAIGFGHECGYLAGLGLRIDSFSVALSYHYRIVQGGTQQGIGFGVGLRG